MRAITAQPLTKQVFAPYGEVIEKANAESFTINRGQCVRHHALAVAETALEGGKTIISIFSGQPYSLPYALDMVERHPLGSQAFYPLGSKDWLVIVCEDESGVPAEPVAFLATPDQGISLNRNQWHGVLTPLYEPSDFLVVDRGGEGNNLQEHYFDQPWLVRL